MNNSAPYEKIIAQKIENLPLPDRADKIWAVIEHELDKPGAEATKKMPSRHSKWVRLTLSALVVVAIIIWFLVHKRQPSQKHVPIPKVMPEKKSQDPGTDSNFNDVYKNEDDKITITPAVATKDTVQYLYPLPSVDSVYKLIFPPVLPDSITMEKTNSPGLVIDSISSAPPTKKPKGVKGISDKDYRVIGNNRTDTGTIKN